MADKPKTDWYEEDYRPLKSGAGPAPEHRVANALDYSAHQLGRIRRALESINEKLEKSGTP